MPHAGWGRLSFGVLMQVSILGISRGANPRVRAVRLTFWGVRQALIEELAGCFWEAGEDAVSALVLWRGNGRRPCVTEWAWLRAHSTVDSGRWWPRSACALQEEAMSCLEWRGQWGGSRGLGPLAAASSLRGHQGAEGPEELRGGRWARMGQLPQGGCRRGTPRWALGEAVRAAMGREGSDVDTAGPRSGL